jgi:hypothetical protein
VGALSHIDFRREDHRLPLQPVGRRTQAALCSMHRFDVTGIPIWTLVTGLAMGRIRSERRPVEIQSRRIWRPIGCRRHIPSQPLPCSLGYEGVPVPCPDRSKNRLSSACDRCDAFDVQYDGTLGSGNLALRQRLPSDKSRRLQQRQFGPTRLEKYCDVPQHGGS